MSEDQTSSEQDLQESIADYLAGDLSEIETQQFEELLSSNKVSAQDKAFWERMQPALKSDGRPQLAGPKLNLASVIHKRLSDESVDTKAAGSENTAPTSLPERTAKEPLLFPQWLRYVSTAAAAALITFALLANQFFSNANLNGAHFVAYNEHGDAIYAAAPSNDTARETATNGKYLPYHNVEHLDIAQPQTAAFAPKVARPYLGLLVKPITLDNSDQETGALVLQVFGDSPAEKAGIKPGDVLLQLAECPMATSHCIPGALKGKAPGDKIDVIYLDQKTNIIHPVSITLGATYE